MFQRKAVVAAFRIFDKLSSIIKACNTLFVVVVCITVLAVTWVTLHLSCSSASLAHILAALWSHHLRLLVIMTTTSSGQTCKSCVTIL